MKNTIFQTVFKGVCLFLLALTTLSMDAQPFKYAHLSQEDKEQKSLELIDEAEFMVEGKVTSSEYIIEKDSTVYLDLTFEVNHWYKGEGEQTIHLIKRKGKVNEITNDNGPTLGGNRTRILLLKKLSDGTYELLKQENSVVVRYKSLSHENFYAVGFIALRFNSVDELSNFLQKVDDIKLPSKKKM